MQKEEIHANEKILCKPLTITEINSVTVDPIRKNGTMGELASELHTKIQNPLNL